MTKELTEKEVRRIAREESAVLIKESLEGLEECVSKNTEILHRLDRLLLGELGTDTDDTLKARATFAYRYAKRNTDLNIVGRALPAMEWFEDMNRREPGQKESKLQTLGRVLGLFTKVEWLLALFGISTAVNFFVAAKIVYDLITHGISGL